MNYLSELKNNQKLMLIVTIGVAVTLLIGTSYALLKSTSKGTNTYTMNVGTLEINFIDSKTNTLNLTNAYPMTDEEGMDQVDVLSFTIKNEGDFNALYNVYIEETSTSPEFKSVIRYASSKDLGVTYESPVTLLDNKYIEQNGLLGRGEEITYKVKMWLDEEADNTYMGATFSAKVVVEALQRRNVVTFDANGGEVSLARKNVEYGEPYGELPIPVRNGYTFMGWNGKNLFDYQNILDNNPTVSLVELNGTSTISWINGPDTSNQMFLKGYFKDNIQYTFSGRIASSTINRLVIYIWYIDGSFESFNYQNNYPVADVFKDIVKTTSENKSISYFRGVHSAREIMYIDINSFQIEEGTEATEYEPYYITSDTKVVQTTDHTLKAIWKEIE